MDPSPAPRVVVRGEVTRRVPPSHATLVLTATGRDRRRDRALAQLGAHQAGVTGLLAQVAELVTRHSTTAVAVWPELAEDSRVTGYVAQVTTEVRLADVDRVGEVAVAAAGVDGCSLSGPSWSLDRDDPAWAQARTDAIGEAVSRARDYAAAVGSTLTGLVELRDVGTGPVVPMTLASASTRMGGGVPAPELDLDPTPQEVHGAVEAVFTLSPPDLDALP